MGELRRGARKAAILCEAQRRSDRPAWAMIDRSMGRKSTRQTGARARIAAAAARIMAEDGIDDFSLAKRKAARQLGAEEMQALPGNQEIEDALRTYRALYQADEHPARIAELRRVALDAMRSLEPFSPYLVGPILKGIAGPYAEIELHLFPDSAKDVEILLLERGLSFATYEARRFSGDRAHPASVFSLSWQGFPLKLSVFDPRAERITLKTSQVGRVMDRAAIAEVEALVRNAEAA